MRPPPTCAVPPVLPLSEIQTTADLYIETWQHLDNLAIKAFEHLKRQSLHAHDIFQRCTREPNNDNRKVAWSTFIIDLRCQHDVIRDFHWTGMKDLLNSINVLISRYGDYLRADTFERQKLLSMRVKQMKYQLDHFVFPSSDTIAALLQRSIKMQHKQSQSHGAQAAFPAQAFNAMSRLSGPRGRG